MEGAYIQAVYHPSPVQIHTVVRQGDLFAKQEQLFSVVQIGPTTLLTLDMDVVGAIVSGPDFWTAR